jgi:predicted O-methyltransferase YrrM
MELSLRRGFPSLVREVSPPRAGELLPFLREWQEAMDVLAPGWEQFDAEFTEIDQMLNERYAKTVLVYPRHFGSEALTSRTLYLIVRARKPRIVLETGVANGSSSLVMLAALARNGAGELHSTDVSSDVGCLLNNGERTAWKYHLITGSNHRRVFEAVVHGLPPIDLFFHDSDHRFAWQMFEFETVRRRMSADGLLGSDDVDASYAFMDLCDAHSWRPLLFSDRRKVTGFAVRTPSR